MSLCEEIERCRIAREKAEQGDKRREDREAQRKRWFTDALDLMKASPGEYFSLERIAETLQAGDSQLNFYRGMFENHHSFYRIEAGIHYVEIDNVIYLYY